MTEGSMRQVVVQYRTKPDRADENQRLVEKVFEELNDGDPGGLRYATFRMADGVSFMHVAVINDPNANPLGETAAFAEFQSELADRCDIPPAPSDTTVVGSYRFFAD
jgi:hypothetical protein